MGEFMYCGLTQSPINTFVLKLLIAKLIFCLEHRWAFFSVKTLMPTLPLKATKHINNCILLNRWIWPRLKATCSPTSRSRWSPCWSTCWPPSQSSAKRGLPFTCWSSTTAWSTCSPACSLGRPKVTQGLNLVTHFYQTPVWSFSFYLCQWRTTSLTAV